MRHTNGEFTESLHSTLRKHEEIHNFKMVKNLGTPVHQSKPMTNFSFFNVRRIGSKALLPSTPSPSSSPSPLPLRVRALSPSPLLTSSSSPRVRELSPSPLITTPTTSRVSRTTFPKRFLLKFPDSVEKHYSQFEYFFVILCRLIDVPVLHGNSCYSKLFIFPHNCSRPPCSPSVCQASTLAA